MNATQLRPIAAEIHRPEAENAVRAAAPSSLTARALAAGAVAVVVTCVLVTWAELVISTIRIGYLQLPPVSFAILVLAVAATRTVDRLLRIRWAFSAAELATVYIMSVMAAMVASHGMVQKLLPLLVTTNYFATDLNNWNHLFNAHVPGWLVPFSPLGPAKQYVAVAYFERVARGALTPWRAWVLPLAVWSLFFGFIFYAFLCLAALLRRQWVDNEKLSFPLAQLPLEIVSGSDGKGFFQRPLMWLGAAIPIAIYAVDWAHQICPSVPLIMQSLSINDYLTNPPWSGMGYTPIIFSFAALGFFYLLPSDVLLSIWFFFLLDRAQQVVGTQYDLNMPFMSTNWLPVFEGYQTIGAYVALAVFYFWLARPHLKRVWAQVVQPRPADEGGGEILSGRAAFFGLWISLAAACVMLALMGMSWWLAAFEILAVVFLIGLVMARSTAEAGMLMTETTFQPYDLYRVAGNLHSVGSANLTLLAFVDHLLSHDQRGLVLTGMLDSSYLAGRVKLRQRSLGVVLMAAIALAALIAIPLQLLVTYKLGALRMDTWMMQGSPRVQFNVDAAKFMPAAPPSPGDWQMPAFFLVGIGVTLLLIVMRTQFYWWPLHPLGYALAGSQSTIEFWFPCLLAWLLKSMTMRYGGRRIYQTWRPFFLGLVFGEFTMAVLSACANIVLRVPAPPFPWQ